MPTLLDTERQKKINEAINDSISKMADIEITDSSVAYIRSLPMIKMKIRDGIDSAIERGSLEYWYGSEEWLPPKQFLEELLAKGYDIKWTRWEHQKHPMRGCSLVIMFHKDTNGTVYEEQHDGMMREKLEKSSLAELYMEPDEEQEAIIRSIMGDMDEDINGEEEKSEGQEILKKKPFIGESEKETAKDHIESILKAEEKRYERLIEDQKKGIIGMKEVDMTIDWDDIDVSFEEKDVLSTGSDNEEW